MKQRNHWVSGRGPFDRCAACGERVDNASESGPVLVTGNCRPLFPVPPDVAVVCEKCCAAPPFFGIEEPGYRMVANRLRLLTPGWCMVCRKFIGDDFRLVPRVSVAAQLVQAFIDSLAS